MRSNVLLSCSGRRNYIVDYFKSLLDGEGRVCAANNTCNVSSMVESDEAALMPSIYEDNYIDQLIDFCDRKEVALVVPLFDLELPILARNKGRFSEQGVTVAVSSLEVCWTCLDKVRSQELLERAGLNTRPMFTDAGAAIAALNGEEIDYPVYVKPRLGMGSIAIYEVQSHDQLRVCFEMAKRKIQETYLDEDSRSIRGEEVIMQERLPGTEYNLDVVNDFQGNHVTTLVKRKLGMRSGETEGAITEDVSELREVGRKLSRALGHIGNLDADVFWDGEDAYVLDMNPRFGGGYPFSHVAGANLPAAYLAWAEGEEPDPSWFEMDYGVKAVKGISLHEIQS